MALPKHLEELENRLASRLAGTVDEFRRAVEAHLRREHERILGALEELPAPAAASWLGEGDLAALEEEPRRSGGRAALAQLLDNLRELDLAANQAAVLDALLDAGRGSADRLVLLLARDAGLVSWGDRGFAEGSIAGRELAWDTTLRERLLASRGCLRLEAESAGEVMERFGASPSGRAVVVPMVLRDRVAALLWADRAEGDVDVTVLQLLVHAAGQRLELQALSDRSYTPTLWEGAEAPGAPLPLWTLLTPAPPEEVQEEAEEEVEEEAAGIWQPEEELAPVEEDEAGATAEVEEESLPESLEASFELTPAEEPALSEIAVEEPEPAAEIPVETGAELAAPPIAAEEEALAPSGDELEAAPPAIAERPAGEVEPAGEAEEWVAAPEPAALEAEAEAWEPVPHVAPETDAVEAAAAAEAEQWEPAGEAMAEPEAGAVEAPPTAEAEPGAEPPADLLGTVKMPVPPVESLAPPRLPEETTAPIATPAEPSSTHEIPSPLAAEPAAAGRDATEDETVLSMRRPELPAPPAPAPSPTWSAPTPEPPASPPPAAEDPMDRTASRMRSTEVAPPPDVSGPGLAFLASRAARTSGDPAHEEAKRLARLLISEIRLYNEEQVLEGRRNRDLYHRLKEDIDRSRQIYDERVEARVKGEADYFQQELVRSLAGGDPRALGI